MAHGRPVESHPSKRKVDLPTRNRARAEAWSLLRFLVEADYVAGGVAEPGSDFGSVGADGLDDFALVGEDGVEGGGQAEFTISDFRFPI
jgi:hypothetical protein